VSELNAAIARFDSQIAHAVAQMVDLEAARNQLLAQRAQALAKRVEEVTLMARLRGADPEKGDINLDFETMALKLPRVVRSGSY